MDSLQTCRISGWNPKRPMGDEKVLGCWTNSLLQDALQIRRKHTKTLEENMTRFEKFQLRLRICLQKLLLIRGIQTKSSMKKGDAVIVDNCNICSIMVLPTSTAP